jgi:adenine phosphoribosyltransferase
MAGVAAQLKALVRDVPDFPRPGIVFKDITTLLRDPQGLGLAVECMLRPFAGEPVDLVVGIESRGFILGAPMAVQRRCGFVPVRKPGKLPAETVREEYELEYGRDAVEIHRDGVGPGQRVLLVDDVLATGGTMSATCRLVEALGGRIVGISFLVELAFLGGRARLPGRRVEAVLAF